MRIAERIHLVEQMLDENPTALAMMIPNETLEVLLARCKDREAIKASEMRWRTRANMYESSYRSAMAENKRLKQKARKLNGYSKTM